MYLLKFWVFICPQFYPLFFPKPSSFLWSISGKCPLSLWWIHGTPRLVTHCLRWIHVTPSLDTHSVVQLNFGSLCDGHCTCPWRSLAELLIWPCSCVVEAVAALLYSNTWKFTVTVQRIILWVIQSPVIKGLKCSFKLTLWHPTWTMIFYSIIFVTYGYFMNHER